jgi:hypothetical protein
MKLRFFWKEQFGKLEPACESDAADSLLPCLLTDTGGLPYLSTLPWIDEGLLRIETVTRGDVESLLWGREDWGAELRRDSVRIYSLSDDSFREDMLLEPLQAALRAWRDFLQTPPDATATRTVLV